MEPGIYRTVLLAPGSTRAPEFDATQPGALGSLLARMPGAAPHGATLLGRSPSGTAAVDGRVVELLSRVFALIQADTQLNAACRAVLARLQVTALRVALHDRGVFESHEHPVWLLMDRIAYAAVGHPVPDDNRLAALLAFCDAVAEEISRSPSGDTALFRRGVARVDSFLAEQLQWQHREAAATIESLRRREKGELLEQHLSQRLSEQMASMRAAPDIRRFVTGTWARVLAESVLQFGEEGEPTPTNMKTVDDLLGACRPRSPAESPAPARVAAEPASAASRRHDADRHCTGGAAVAARSPDGRAHRGAPAGAPRRRDHADLRTDRAAHARRGHRGRARRAALQRLGDRPGLDGHGAGRLPAHRCRRRQRRGHRATRRRSRPGAATAPVRAGALDPRPAVVAQRSGPLFPLRRRTAGPHALDHAGRARAARGRRAGAAAGGQVPGSAHARRVAEPVSLDA